LVANAINDAVVSARARSFGSEHSVQPDTASSLSSAVDARVGVVVLDPRVARCARTHRVRANVAACVVATVEWIVMARGRVV
jgi:hypothetical protein